MKKYDPENPTVEYERQKLLKQRNRLRYEQHFSIADPNLHQREIEEINDKLGVPNKKAESVVYFRRP